MKKLLVSALAFISHSVLADPTVFNMELGKTSENEVKEMYSVVAAGKNYYSNGNFYNIPTHQIDFDGLKNVQVIFDNKGVLVAVLTNLHKSKFDYLNSILSKKYKLVKKEIPFVGNKLVKFRDGGTEIILDAPHLSFEMDMLYIRSDFFKKYQQKSTQDKNSKKNSEASQL